MMDWPRTTDVIRPLLHAALVLTALAATGRSATAVGGAETITLWSAENESGATEATNVPLGRRTVPSPIYRLPPPRVVTVPSDVGLTIENHFVTEQDPVPPSVAVDYGTGVVDREGGDRTSTATTGYSGDVDTEVVDHLSSAAPPPPPLVGVRSVASPVDALGADFRRVDTHESTDGRRDDGPVADPRWSMDERAAEMTSQAITTPDLEESVLAREWPPRDTNLAANEAPIAAESLRADTTPIGFQPRSGDWAQGEQSARPVATLALPNTPTVAQVSDQVIPAMRKAYGLAGRGAYYAARSEFLEVLRRIAQAKDAEFGTNQHARALAEGLRALDEADDFMPFGVQLEADLDVPALVRSHRTPVLRKGTADVLPHEAIAHYHAFAGQRLAAAVAGEQAGSMALYGLGKIHRQLAAADGDLQSNRKSITMYQAALTAHPANHLAANELGVLLTEDGHHAEAVAMFRRAIQIMPTATAYQNLSVVQRRLGNLRQAAVSEQEAQRLAQWERSVGAVSHRLGVRWVSPDQMARLGPAPERPAVQVASAAPGPPPRRPQQEPTRTAWKLKWPWQRGEKESPAVEPPQPRVAQPINFRSHGPQFHPRMDPIESDTIWR